MTTATNRLLLNADFYRLRAVARELLGADYASRVDQWARLVRFAMERTGGGAGPAALELISAVDDQVATMMLAAAAVEVLEATHAH